MSKYYYVNDDGELVDIPEVENMEEARQWVIEEYILENHYSVQALVESISEDIILECDGDVSGETIETINEFIDNGVYYTVGCDDIAILKVEEKSEINWDDFRGDLNTSVLNKISQNVNDKEISLYKKLREKYGDSV